MRSSLALVLTLATTTVAQPATDDRSRRLAAGEVLVETHADSKGVGRVTAAIEIAAPPSVVWRTLLDCSRAAKISPGVKSCRVVSRAQDGTEIREHAVKWSFFLPTLRSTARVTLEPDRTIRFTCIGGDIRACDGSWTLEPTDGGRRTRVAYEMWAVAPFAVPAGLVGGMMRRDAPQSLKALRRECENR